MMRAALLLAMVLTLVGCDRLERGPVGNRAVPQPSKPVELNGYLGLWYELARYENGFEKGCEGVTARYALRADGKISVVNTCRRGAPDGPPEMADGRAKVVPNSAGAKLKVSFFGPFYGDYWVLDHAPDYSWSIVGEPSGRYLWLLTREPNPPQAARQAMLNRAAQLGYNMALLRFTRH
jgi:apolipoprotein D and lipocalin family protein